MKQKEVEIERTIKMEQGIVGQDNLMQVVTIPSESRILLNKILIFHLLISPFIMGIIINSLGNAAPIKYNILVQYNKFNGISSIDDIDSIQPLPKYIWSMRFLFPLGGMVGSLMAGYLGNKIGRKLSTILFLISVMIGAVLKIGSYYAHFALLFIGCFFEGVGAAGIMVVDLMLMFELMSIKMTKFAKPMVQIFINFGIFFIACITLNSVAGLNYQYTFIVPIILAFINCLVVYFIPESPVYLYEKTKNTTQVLKVLSKVHGQQSGQYLEPITECNLDDNKTDEQVSIIGIFKDKKYRVAIISSIFLHCAQQLSGINAIMAFAPDVLSKIGLSNPDRLSLIILSVSLFGSIIFAPLVVNFKRKLSLLIGHGTMGISLIAGFAGFKYNAPYQLTLFFFCLFVFIFQIGPGPLVWFITLEIYPKKAVNSAQSICVCANWLSNALVFAIADLSIYVFIVFAVVNMLIFIYCFLFVVETIDRKSEDILEEYEKRYAIFPCC